MTDFYWLFLFFGICMLALGYALGVSRERKYWRGLVDWGVLVISKIEEDTDD